MPARTPRTAAKSTTTAKAPAKATTRAKASPTKAKAAGHKSTSSMAAAKKKAKVAGVGEELTPRTPPGPLVGVDARPAGGLPGKIYDAMEFFASRQNLGPGGELRLFHHTEAAWGTPGQKTWVSTGKSGGGLGDGFYVSTVPETGYGQAEFQLALPMKAFQGKKIFEVESGGTIVMPPGVDILSFKYPGNDPRTWLVFKDGSADWLNKSATTADFDAPGEAIGWS
ncbi:MAG: hypothetical protein K1X89_26010 [Myxococcaceae bacterium]|nr:hypothetical protein [Myxococcaceae bacterium]